MNQVYFNGKITTLDPSIPSAQAIAVKNGIIARVGSNEEILALSSDVTEKIDLQGKLMLPAFSDSHMHLLFYANSKRKVDLFNCTSLTEAIELGQKGLSTLCKDDVWLLGCGWNQDNWETPIFPTRHDLDKISLDVPVAYTRACYHITVLNSKGLALLGITKNTPQLCDGSFDIDEEGNPTGVLRENAQSILMNNIPAPSLAEIKNRIIDAAKDALAQGITSIHSDDFECFAGDNSDLIIRAYSELAEDDKLPLRVYQQCLLRTPELLKSFLDKGHKTGNEIGFYKLGPLKLLNDGSLGARTAYLRQPYNDAPDTRGMSLYTPSDLDKMIQLGHDGGMQLAVHCIGDASMEMTINSIEKAVLANPRIDTRHGIIHAQITDIPMLERYRKLRLIAYAQPIFLRYDCHMVDCRVGSDLASTSYNWRAFIDMGVHMAGGSDCPVEKFDILPNIYCAVTRKDFDGWPSSGWYPENCITVAEAVNAFTYENAYAAFQENERGSLSVGKYADMVVLEKDIYSIPAIEIKDVTVEMTIVNGEVKYKK